MQEPDEVIESKLDEELEEVDESKEDVKKEDTPPVEIEGNKKMRLHWQKY
jgi:hypothetical protein